MEPQEAEPADEAQRVQEEEMQDLGTIGQYGGGIQSDNLTTWIPHPNLCEQIHQLPRTSPPRYEGGSSIQNHLQFLGPQQIDQFFQTSPLLFDNSSNIQDHLQSFGPQHFPFTQPATLLPAPALPLHAPPLCRLGHNHFPWSRRGRLVIEKCERRCDFCGTELLTAAALRKHVYNHKTKDGFKITIAPSTSGRHRRSLLKHALTNTKPPRDSWYSGIGEHASSKLGPYPDQDDLGCPENASGSEMTHTAAQPSIIKHSTLIGGQSETSKLSQETESAVNGAHGSEEVGALQRDIIQVKAQLKKLQQQHNAVSDALSEVLGEYRSLCTHAMLLRNQCNRHENSVKAIITFGANVFRK